MKQAAWAIIPIKDLESSKTRLGKSLSAGLHHELVSWMLGRVLQAMREARGIARTLVIGGRLTEAAAAGSFDFWLPDPGAGLNAALVQARQFASSRGAGSFLFAHADLPLLSAAAVDRLLDHCRGGKHPLVLCPDWRLSGTNLLYCRRDVRPDLVFGPDSFRLFRRQLRRLQVGYLVWSAVETALDIDSPADLERLQQIMGEEFYDVAGNSDPAADLACRNYRAGG